MWQAAYVTCSSLYTVLLFEKFDYPQNMLSLLPIYIIALISQSLKPPAFTEFFTSFQEEKARKMPVGVYVRILYFIINIQLRMKQPIPMQGGTYPVGAQPYPSAQYVSYAPPHIPRQPTQPVFARPVGPASQSYPLVAQGPPPQGPIMVSNSQPVRGVPMGMPVPGSVVSGAPPVMPGSRVLGSPFGGYPVYYMPVQQKPRADYNLNFNYEQANFLCDTTIVENKVFCVICGQDFRGSERDEHLKRHIRKGGLQPSVEKVEYVTKTSSRRNFITKPIVEPEEHNIQYQPMVYNLVQQVVYEDPEEVQVRNQAIGFEPSFQNDPNISMDERRNNEIPGDIRTESNPFRSSNNNQGNTLNEPVPFLGENPQSQGQQDRSHMNYSYSNNPNRSNLSNESLVIDEGRNDINPNNQSIGI